MSPSDEALARAELEAAATALGEARGYMMEAVRVAIRAGVPASEVASIVMRAADVPTPLIIDVASR